MTMKHHSTALVSLLLALCLLVGTLASCAGGEDPADTDLPGTDAGTEAGTEPDPFADVDYGGRPFSIYTSVYDYSNGMGNSNFLIEGVADAVDDHLNQAVLERNQVTEERLGVTLSFTQADLNYDAVAADVRKLLSSGTHEYDLIINDLFPLATLSLEGSFRNVLEPEAAFDFTQPCWYADFMADSRLLDGYGYLLAGDATIDVLRSVHCLLFNKTMYEQYYHTDPAALYDAVENYEWTYEKMTEVISGLYVDLNDSGKRDAGDRYGYLGCTYWGETIAFAVSAAPGFVAREEGTVRISLGETQRAEDLVSALTALFHHEDTSMEMTDYTKLLEAFVDGQCLFVGNQRLGSLENPVFRGRTAEVGVLPYPMLYASDRRYNTAAHDTTEIGVIPATETDLPFASTVIEVFCRETASRLIPRYYSEALQIRYVDDPRASDMIAIIHDNISECFALAYNSALGSQMLNTFSDASSAKRSFSALWAKREKSISSSLEKQIKTFVGKVG